MSEFQQPFSGLFRLDGKVAVITGGLCPSYPLQPNTPDLTEFTAGSRGLGLHTATAFLLAGAKKVILVARKAEGPQGFNQAVDKLNTLSGATGCAIGYAADLSKLSEVERLVELLREEDRIDILVANAAATWGGPLETTPDWAASKVLDLNVRSIFNLTRL